MTDASWKYWKISRALPQRFLSILTQLQTGYFPLQQHLYCIKRAESPACPCYKQKPKMMHHYLMECPVHCNPRAWLRLNIPQGNWTMTELLTNERMLKHLFNL
ncbi:hypothetical protein BT96DRAFT_817615 [Gymnopus androsaceus JB14]|uniref:Reverse transcriptase zinc-binding domain-containing protein n=1 Tax=Gymnopus androsaceus JB14 TaxID=1447944 RepID=A0A6A4HYI4_9AGAR|nr:hypothetical protein BT96DRAFT_817615 [Gymnopus androsaceus JB14]